jgi:hypothetical protein
VGQAGRSEGDFASPPHKIFLRSLGLIASAAYFHTGVLASGRPDGRPRLHSVSPCTPASRARLQGPRRPTARGESPFTPLRFSRVCTQTVVAVGDYSRWLRQHPEEGEGAADAQPAPGGGGDTEAKVRQQKKQRQIRNTRSTFEIFGCNTCNIRLKTYKTCI